MRIVLKKGIKEVLKIDLVTPISIILACKNFRLVTHIDINVNLIFKINRKVNFNYVGIVKVSDFEDIRVVYSFQNQKIINENDIFKKHEPEVFKVNL